MSNTGFISRMQHFSTEDGRGIRTTVFLQCCNLHCVWCHNPETLCGKGSLMLYDKLCGKCGLCAKVCENKAHTVDNGVHTYKRELCNLCGKCRDVCLNNAIVISGKKMTVDKVYDYIAEDTEFYAASGGGVTLSGGEPMLQADFCMQLAKKCKEENISVFIDTAADVGFDILEQISKYTDEFMIDLKAHNEADYKKYTGGSFYNVTENIKKLIQLGNNVLIRIPVIPMFNDKHDDMEKYADVMHSLGVKRVELLPFHRLGSSKYKALGLDYAYSDTQPPEDSVMTDMNKILKQKGFEVL